MKVKFILLVASSMLMLSNTFGQSHVNTNGKKYTLVEEATGEWCGWCPDGAQVIEQVIEPSFPHAIIASWHNSDPFQVSNDPYCTGTGYITGFPLGTVNRSSSWSGGIQQDRGQWAIDCATDSSATPNFDVSMTCTYDTGTRIITIGITGKAKTALTGNWNISGLITVDSLAPTGQHSYLDAPGTMCADGQPSWFVGQCASACPGYACTSCAVLPTSVYSHMNVVVHILANNVASSNDYGTWGDAAFTNPTSGTSVTKNYTYTIPSTYNYKKVKVIGMVQKYGSTTTDRAIENSVQAKVVSMYKNLLGVSELQNTLEDVNVYPNPAGNYIHVSGNLSSASETSVIISNIMGQVVLEKHYTPNSNTFSENISLDNVANGIYLMTMLNNGEKVTRKFTVNK